MDGKSATDRPSGSRKIMRGRRSLLRTVRRQELVEIDIEIDGADYRDGYLAVEIMNTASSGPALPLAPDADPGDGWLDVVLIRGEDREPFLEWIDAPQHGRPDFGRVVRARSVSIAWTGEPLRIDDELAEPQPAPGRVRIEIEPVPVLVMGLSQPGQDVRKEYETEAAA
jgi:diacylglycerol kinase family enzyme